MNHENIAKSLQILSKFSLIMENPEEFNLTNSKRAFMQALSWQKKQSYWICLSNLLTKYENDLVGIKLGFNSESEFLTRMENSHASSNVIYFLAEPVWSNSLTEPILTKLNKSFRNDYKKIVSKSARTMDDANDILGPFRIDFSYARDYSSYGYGSAAKKTLRFSSLYNLYKPIELNESSRDSILIKAFGEDLYGVYKSMEEAKIFLGCMNETKNETTTPKKNKPGL